LRPRANDASCAPGDILRPRRPAPRANRANAPASRVFADDRYAGSSGRHIGDFARANDVGVVTTGADFCELATTIGPPRPESGILLLEGD
jgi:hypothetical protein